MAEERGPRGRETIVLAADHAGYELKERIKAALEARGCEVLDLGTHGTESVDYPDFGDAMAAAIADEPARRGVLVCGTGIGIAIAANRHRHVRAAVCCSRRMAELAREHNDANVLALGARVLDEETALACLDGFLETPFGGGRHVPRVEKLSRGCAA